MKLKTLSLISLLLGLSLSSCGGSDSSKPVDYKAKFNTAGNCKTGGAKAQKTSGEKANGGY